MKTQILALLLACVFAELVVGQQNYIAAINTQAQCLDSKKLDGTSDCQANSSNCGRSGWVDLMTRMCPRTCCRCVNAALNGGGVYYYRPIYSYPYYYYGRK